MAASGESGGTSWTVPLVPARDIQVLAPQFHPPKKGLSSPEGLARLLHDLASIELQAMELGLRTLAEFPQAQEKFRNELCEVTRSEGQHLKLCVEGLRTLGFEWGAWPVHCALWLATSEEDALLDRLLIVHRYLEGSGLDAGDQILRRLKGARSPEVKNILEVITRDEVGHVHFGSHWYRYFCQEEGLDPEIDFPRRMKKLKSVLPRRIEKLSYDLRKQAGFTDFELKICEEIRAGFL